MATITYDPSEAQEGEFTEEEQDSIAVGEKLAEQEQQLLAGKFQDAEQLEKAYVELQRKLGSQDNEPEAEEETQEEEEVEPVEGGFLEQVWDEAMNGEYTQETLDQLAQMHPNEIAQEYLNYRAEVESQPQAEVLSEEDIDALQGLVGGKESYGNMMAWAQESLTPQEVEMYDSVMEKGDPVSCFFAVQALGNRYADASVGTQGEFVSGGTPRESKDAFRSQAEVVRAMHDPRYDNDPAYRDDVMQKLERSQDIMF